MSTNDEFKPSPDELLKAVQKEEKHAHSGKLKIFFGMAAGVGKTYAMLEEAQQKQKDGVDVVVGTVNTHGRKETEELLKGLTVIPEKWVKYKELAFSEMDLETILRLKPQLVLVDELAHTNVPGSKHPKRWQDVIELLDAGMDVFTTLNVQHLESRKDLVESIAGVQIRETVPDLILERATSIELVDIPPQELLQRLKEGKVYLGDQSKVAAENFFQEGNLTALREIALRFTAEKVDHDLHGILLMGKGWKTREKLMVAVSPSPSSQWVIRAARRLAFELDAPWIAVYVDTGRVLCDPDQARLMSHLNLARDLGAEVITTHDIDVAAALQRIASQKDITRIVLGRSPDKKKTLFNFWKDSLVDTLEKENKNIDIVVLRDDPVTEVYKKYRPKISFTSPWSSYGLVLLFVLGLTLLGLAINPIVGHTTVGFIYLFGILMLSFFVGLGPIILGAVLSGVVWDFLFTQPWYSLTIDDPKDIAFLITYLCTTVIMGMLTNKFRTHEQFLQKRQQNIQNLYEVQQTISSATNVQSLRQNVTTRLQTIFPGVFDILIKNLDGQLILDSPLPFLQKEKEKTVAQWVAANGKTAGWSTDTLPAAEAIYFPIKFAQTITGVLVYHPKSNRPLSMDELTFIETVTQQLGVYFERYIFEERLNRQEYARQVEKLHSAIMHSLNRSFYGPVEGILEVHSQIKRVSTDPKVTALCARMESLMGDIKLTADNMIALSELDSGHVHFERRPNSIVDLINACLEEVKPFTNRHSIEVHGPSQPLFIPCDYNLLKLSLKNLLLNAIQFSPVSQPITIQLQMVNDMFRLSVIDQGPSIPEEVLALIFEKFYRSDTSKGMGLGLAVVKSVAEIHQGKIEVKNLSGGGSEFSLVLPVE